MTPPGFVVTCEHGGFEVPAAYRARFTGAQAVLRSHRGWDPGALGLARFLAAELDAPLHFGTVTRLVVDLNRSPTHPRVFSEYTRSLDAGARRDLLARHHRPYRERVREIVEGALAEGRRVIHLSVHSFTPVLDGKERRTELALLYDPARERERELAARWTAALRALLPDRRIRRNHPYLGVSDGLTTSLRSRFASGDYLGLEIEVSQGLLEEGRFPAWVGEALLEGLARATAPG